MDLKELGALFAAASDNGEKVSLLQLKSLINKVVHRRVSVRLRSMLAGHGGMREVIFYAQPTQTPSSDTVKNEKGWLL